MILNVSEAAKKVGASRSTLYNMKKTGEISFSMTADGKPGIEESELARVFPDRFKTVDKKQRKSVLNTSNTSPEKSDQLIEKIEILQNMLNERMEKELNDMRQRAGRAEERVDELMKITQDQSKQLLLSHQTKKKSLWKRMFGSAEG